MADLKDGETTWKRLPAMALTMAVVLVVVGVVIAAYAERAYREQKLREADVQAHILAAAVTAALSFDDRAAAQEYVNALAANPEVETAAVYDAAGNRFAAYTRKGLDSAPDAFPGASPPPARNALTVSSPVAQGTARLGTVWLSATVEPLANRLERYAGIALLVSMGSLVVVVLGVAHGTLSRANAALSKHAAELEAAYTKLRAETTEREKAEEALRQSQKMEAVGQLTGGIAHDFNNLLQAVGGSLELLERRLAVGRTDVDKYARAAREAVNRAAALTQRLLAFSRRQPLNPRRVDLNALVLGMQDLIRRSIGESIHLNIALEARVRGTWADANQLENALLNLVINARDAMPKGGRLTIATTGVAPGDPRLAAQPELAPGEYVALTVADTGTGMPPDVLARAFEPFFTTKPIGQGTGLGLSQLYGFARQSGGHVGIDSAVGRGTAVTLFLPCHDGAPEDEALVRMLLVATLEEHAYRVIEAEDAEAALRIVESSAAIDLLATDVGLPGLNGRQLAEMARAVRPELKVLFLTGYAHNSGFDGDGDGLGPGMDLLAKPVSMDTFLAKVRDMTMAGQSAAV